jgi:oxygen-dependent protoporphyrinogen oxidase
MTTEGFDTLREAHVVIIGAGISGLACAHRLLTLSPGVSVTIIEAQDHVGGVIKTSPFAGFDAVDEAADAFLLRAPAAMTLAREVGLGDHLTSPTSAHASVWRGKLHKLPPGLILGVPSQLGTLATSRLISTRGKLRAALEPLLPRTSTDTDCIGAFMRKRLGNEIHENLIDPLVGSIYATDTDHFSLRAMPQLAELAGEGRSLLLSAKRRPASPPVSAQNPVFAAPLSGMGGLVSATAASVRSRGGTILTSTRVESVEPTTSGCAVHVSSHGETRTIHANHVVFCAPARHSAAWVRDAAPEAAQLLGSWEHASVVMLAIAVPVGALPREASGSGYLVPKPNQRFVTAVSFASQKWAHLRSNDTTILRVSLGRDGAPQHQHSDEELLSFALADLKLHLGVDLAPTAVRLTRWVESFPQYRPGHFDRVDHVEQHLASRLPAVSVAGASYRGIGVPACVQQGFDVATRLSGANT